MFALRSETERANFTLTHVFNRCLNPGLTTVTSLRLAATQAMSRPTYSAICSHAAGQKPALVFVPTRKHARLAALDLLTYAAADG